MPGPGPDTRSRDRGRVRPGPGSARRSGPTPWPTRRGVTARSGRWSATTVTGSLRRPCCACCATKVSCWRPTTSVNAASWPPTAGPRSRPRRPARYLRLAAGQLPSSRPRPVGPGGSPAAGTTGASTPAGSTSPRPRTPATRVAAVELALAEAAELGGRPLVDLAEVDDQGNIKPVVTIVTDNGGPFRSFRFEAPVATHPELRHVRTRVRTPGQNGSRERGFGSLKYERGVPRRDPRRPGPGSPRRALPGRVQHRPTPREPVLEPSDRGPPRLRRPEDPQLSRTPEPAICLTRDTDRGPRRIPRVATPATR